MSKITQYTCSLLLLLAACTGSQDKKADSAADSTTSKKNEQPASMKTILFFGNSLTAGYGLEPEEAFPALIQDKIDSLHLPYKVINAGNSGETTAGGKNRIDWLLKQKVDVFVLELGANDGLRGIPVSETTANLQSIVDQVKAKYPDVKMVMTGMQVPPNMGSKYASEFSQVFKEIADKNDMAYVPFLLNKVGGVAKLNQSDGIHPTAEGQMILAENVWEILKDIL
ncbi:arylesterase [Flavihumibacter sp. R14]|nr:arylesterase [Flavihumibacter soli]